MKTTSDLIQETLSKVNGNIPSLIEKLDKSIQNKETEVKDILEIAKSLKSTMEKFADSIEEIKSLTEFIEITKRTNSRLEEINETIMDVLGVVGGLNDKINKVNKKIGKKDSSEIEKEAFGGYKESGKIGKGFSFFTPTNILIFISLILNVFVLLKLFKVV